MWLEMEQFFFCLFYVLFCFEQELWYNANEQVKSTCFRDQPSEVVFLIELYLTYNIV